MKRTHLFSKVLFVSLFGVFVLSACSNTTAPRIPRKRVAGEVGTKYESNPRPSVFGKNGLSFGGPKTQANVGAGSGGIGVNSYLWRATLDTVAFLPVSSADPFGGVIITDWYAPPESPKERFKLNIYILGRALRADGLRVSVFRQQLDDTGAWRDAQVEADAGRKIEDEILTRARQLRNETRRLKN